MKIFEYIKKAFSILFITKMLKTFVPLVVIVIGAYFVREKGNEIPSAIIIVMGCLLLYLVHVPIKGKKTNNNYQSE